MRLGVHLPLAVLGIGVPTADDLLAAYAAAAAGEVLVWPLRDPVQQLERCAAAFDRSK